MCLCVCESFDGRGNEFLEASVSETSSHTGEMDHRLSCLCVCASSFGLPEFIFHSSASSLRAFGHHRRRH